MTRYGTSSLWLCRRGVAVQISDLRGAIEDRYAVAKVENLRSRLHAWQDWASRNRLVRHALAKMLIKQLSESLTAWREFASLKIAHRLQKNLAQAFSNKHKLAKVC